MFDSLKSGNAAIKALQSEINLDDVQKLMDETAEAQAYQDVSLIWNVIFNILLDITSSMVLCWNDIKDKLNTHF